MSDSDSMSDNDSSIGNEGSESDDSIQDEEDVDYGALEPYQDEPLASERDAENDEPEEYNYQDPDGIPQIVLERRFERILQVENWYVVHCCFYAIINAG